MTESVANGNPALQTDKKEMARQAAAEADAGAEQGDPGKAGAVREALPQILASCAKNMLLLDIGMTMAFPTVVIAALLRPEPGDHQESQEPPDPSGLSFDKVQASWFGSLMLICQPFGSILSGLLLESLGRKLAMLLVNGPHLLAWLLLATARAPGPLFAAAALMGLGMGFMEAPIITYVGEISTPKLRGALTAMAGISVMLGFFLEFLVGTLVPWRTAAWASVSVPILTVIAVAQVPESPIWLVSKGRVRDAERALCWLRGWVQPCAVQTELAELVSYNAQMTAGQECEDPPADNGIGNAAYVPDRADAEEGKQIPATPVTAKGESLHSNSVPVPKSSWMDGVRALGRRETLRPLLLVISFFVFHHWTGLSGLRPFMVPVFRQFGLPIEAHWVTVLSAVLGMGGNVLCMVAVPWCGKRPLALTSIGGVSAACLMLGAYGLVAAGTAADAAGSNPDPALETSWLPLVLFIALFSFHSFGIGPIPWVLLSEVFPYQGRGLATGIAAAVSYVLGFFAAKTFLDIQALIGLSGVFLMNGTAALVGLIFMYFCLPETEGRTLQEIEATYAKKKKKKAQDDGVVVEKAVAT